MSDAPFEPVYGNEIKRANTDRVERLRLSAAVLQLAADACVDPEREALPADLVGVLDATLTNLAFRVWDIAEPGSVNKNVDPRFSSVMDEVAFTKDQLLRFTEARQKNGDVPTLHEALVTAIARIRWAANEIEWSRLPWWRKLLGRWPIDPAIRLIGKPGTVTVVLPLFDARVCESIFRNRVDIYDKIIDGEGVPTEYHLKHRSYERRVAGIFQNAIAASKMGNDSSDDARHPTG